MGEAKRTGGAGVAQVLRQTAAEWAADRSPEIAAALAYYALFSIAPLLVLATAAAGLLYGKQAASGAVLTQVSKMVGPRVALVLQDILVAASRPRAGLIASIVGVVTIIVGATGLFASVQSALDRVWKVEPRPGRGVSGVLHDRLPTFLLLLAVGALVVASLAASTWLGSVMRRAPAGALGGVAAQGADFLLFVAVMTVLFALVFKTLPDARIAWRDVWLGGAVTAALFAVGQLLIGLYLTFVSVGSLYGAAGSLIALLVWLYYSAQVFLFGAELTQIEAARRGSRIEPASNARRVAEPCTPGQPMRPAAQ